MKTTLPFAFTILALLGGGCTHLSVKPVTATNPDADGIRYSLPKPFLQVSRQSDGGMAVDVVYLPDSSHTYAVTSKSYLASNNLTVGVDAGLLKKLNWTADSAAVVAQGVESATSVADRRATEAKKLADAAETARTSKLAAAEKAVADAELAVALAQSDLRIYQQKGTAADVLKAEISLAQAIERLAHASSQLAHLKGADDGNARAFDNPVNGRPIPGAVLYAINETGQNGPRLDRQVNTEFVPLPAAKPPKLYPQGRNAIRPDKNGDLVLVLALTSAAADLIVPECQLLPAGSTQAVSLPGITLEAGNTQIKATLTGTPPGPYELFVAIKWGEKKPTERHKVDVHILK